MRSITLFLLLGVAAMVMFGCAGNPTVPSTGDEGAVADSRLSGMSRQDGPHRLWGEWTLYFNEDHTRVDAVPMRSGRFHLNALKFLEDYCRNCLRIVSIRNNGDGTIDLMVRITHPFAGHPEFTGFDVKGIIMFDGSWENEGYYLWLPWPEPFRISWRKLGDPQVLNADGYSILWSPWYDSGSDMPIFNYWEGRFARGTPTANINAFKNFYTDEERHMFRVDGSVTQTYKIWLPPGPVTAGYAIDACWEPPIKTPVTNPVEDFPLTANQPEAYEFRCVINSGEPVTDPECCGHHDPSEFHLYSKQWGGHTALGFAWFTDAFQFRGGVIHPCGDEWPDHYCDPGTSFIAAAHPDGDYIGVAINDRGDWPPPLTRELAYTVFEFTIDLE